MGDQATHRSMADHPWFGDEDGHNCVECEHKGDTLRLCWPANHPSMLWWKATIEHWRAHQDHECDACTVGLRWWMRREFIVATVERSL